MNNNNNNNNNNNKIIINGRKICNISPIAMDLSINLCV